MKTFSKQFDGTGTVPQQITEHEVSTASKNASGYLAHLATLAVVLASFFMTACEPEPEYSGSYPSPAFNSPSPMVINNMFPSAGAPGSTVAILGENFDTSTSDNYVTFGSSYAEIVHVTQGLLTVRVPMDIPEGDYKIRILSNGQSADAPHVFSVIKDTK